MSQGTEGSESEVASHTELTKQQWLPSALQLSSRLGPNKVSMKLEIAEIM